MSLLLERERELDRLSGLVERAGLGRGGVVAIEGPPGIGKTRLGWETATLARGHGMAVLSACGSELEQAFGFGAVRQLFEPVLANTDQDRRRELFEGPARLAAPALGLEPAEPLPERDEARFAVIHGLQWLTANLAGERPLLLWVDDLQWVDEPSGRFLAYLGRRISGVGALLVVGVRPALPGEQRAPVDAIASGRDTLLVRPGPLSVDAISALARERLGAGEPAFAEACRRVTGGNALLVEELLAELEESGRGADPRAIGEIESTGIERVGRGVARRLETLPPGAVELAEAVAILGDGCPLDAAAALAGLDGEAAARSAEGLAAADIFARDRSLRFRHPLVRSAVADRLSAVRGAAAHARAARILAARDAPGAVVAAHLMESAPAGDPFAVDVLRSSAREALRQGAPDLAAGRLRRALDEPPAGAVSAAVLLELGAAEQAAGLPSGPDHMREAISLIEAPTERALAALRLATALAERQRWSEGAQVVRAALDELGDRDRELQLRLHAQLADCVRMDLSVSGDEALEIRRLAATLPGDTPGERLVLATAATLTPADTAAAHAAAAELLDRSLVLDPEHSARPETGIVSNFIRAGQLERAETVIERVMAEARAKGLVHRHALMLSMRGWVGFERGDLGAAEEDLRDTLDFAQELSIPAAPLAAMLAAVLAERGEPTEAGEVLDEFGVSGPLAPTQVMNLALYFRARVRQAQGRHDDAIADAVEVGRRYERWQLRRAVPPWRSLSAVPLAGRGEEERAVALAEEELVLAERWDTPLARGLAVLGLGLVTGDVQGLRAAADELRRSPSRLELARAQVELGAALRRAGSRTESRGPLSHGMDLAHACGAKPLAERARVELLATGARPRRLALTGAGSLTPSERRVAELAASGLSNRQIAQDLFVTTSTVETHLRHAFRKLDLRSRAGLADALSDSSG